MRKGKRRYLFLLGIIIVLTVAGYFLMTGGMPLKDGTKLGNNRVTMVVDKFIAAYLVELVDGGVILIDATMDPNATAIKSSLAKLNKSDGDVVGILFTHGHGDHIAGALSFPNAKIYVLAPDADLVEGKRVANSVVGRFRDPELTGITVTNALSDGDVFSIGGTKIKVFSVPGHTLGSAAYLVYGVLFLGDSAAATSVGTVGGAPPIFSADRKRSNVSLRRLARHLNETPEDKVETLAFGHQGPLTGLAPLLDWAFGG